MKYKFTLLSILVCWFVSLHGQASTTYCQIKWTGIDTWQANESSKKVLSFTDAQYPSDNFLPYFVKSMETNQAFSYGVSVENAVFTPVSPEELPFLQNEYIPDNIQILSSTSQQRDISYLNIQILPFIIRDGQYLKLTGFDLKINQTPAPQKAPSASPVYAESSVLATGKFVKVKVVESGIYKLTYETLNSMGIKPADVRVFGYGGALQEQNLALPKPDDLPEVAIWMEKGADGVFNAGDFILFYAQGLTKWKYDASRKTFTHTLNMYANEGYYFITSDAGTGKKIQPKTTSLPDGATVNQITEFTDYQVHELEKYNLGRTGKVFYGEIFDDNVSYNFPFSFPNIVNSATTKARIDVAAISSASSSYTLKLNDAQAQSASLSAMSGDNYEIAKDLNTTFTYTPNADNLVFNLTYTKPNTSAKGYLNYLEVNVRRKLTMTGNVMFFRNVDNAFSTTYNHFQLTGAGAGVQVWDITDPGNIRQITVSRNGDNIDFYDSNEVIKEYVAINPGTGSAFKEPISAGNVPNQNIHGMQPADFVILTHPNFLKQAEELAQAHRTIDNMTVNVVTTDQVYNEFSSGTPDATAYRWMMKMWYDRSNKSFPKYLLLFGRGSYDNRGIIPNSGDNLILTYQADASLHHINAYLTDDYFGFLDDREGVNIPADMLDIGIGRFPVITDQQATDVVKKTVDYMKNTRKGSWKNQLCFVGDDGGNNEGNMHMIQSDSIAERIFKSNPGFQINKIYLDAYLQEKTAVGDTYPLAKAKLNNLLQSGIFMLNFSGHASFLGWTDEQVLTAADVKDMYNSNLPLWIAATCDFVLFDVKNISTGEQVLLNPNGGGIGLFSAARVVYASQNKVLNMNFTESLFKKVNGQYNRLGDAVRRGKILTGNDGSNKLSYTLFGDPAVRLNYPTEYNVVTEKINNHPVLSTDTIKALSINTIQGYIADENNNKASNFNGTLEITIYDKIQKITTLNNHKEANGVLVYKDRPNIIYSGKAKIENGEFSFTFMTPKDIRYNFGSGRISYYANDPIENKEGQGYYENFIVGGSTTNYLNETDGPVINMYLNSENFVSGGKVNETPLFVANISDVSGINTVGSGIGHDLRLIVDENANTSYTLNNFFTAETNSYTSGTVQYKLPKLAPGKHTLTFHAWDLLNNSSSATLDFEVVSGLTPSLFSVFNFPNPVSTHTQFVVKHDRPGSALQTTLDIFDLTGRKIWSETQNSTDNLTWNRMNAAGGKVPPGVYIYRISIKTPDSKIASKSNKIVVIGQ